MDKESLIERLTNLLNSITGEPKIRTKFFVEEFTEDIDLDKPAVIQITSIYRPEYQVILYSKEYFQWDETEDGPLPGIKLFRDMEIYLEVYHTEK